MYGKNQIIGYIGFGYSIILIVFFSDIILILKDFSERYISVDHHITIDGILRIQFLLSFLILLFIVMSSLFAFNLNKRIAIWLLNSFDWIKIKEMFLTDAICSKKQLPLLLFVMSTLSGFLMHSYFLLFGSPLHEGVLEKYSSLLFLFSGLILMASIFITNKIRFSNKVKKQLIKILIVLSGVSMFVFFEEISWGQRIFNWDSFWIFNDFNCQKETNIHNFFNPLFIYIYPTVGLMSFISMVFIWFFLKNKSYLFQLLTPPPYLFFILLFMTCFSFYGHSEIYEELLAIFFLLYSIRVFICLKFHSPLIPIR